MSDWFSTAIAMQREILQAQETQLDAARKILDANGKMIAWQEAGQRVGEANMRAFDSWAKLWGWRR